MTRELLPYGKHAVLLQCPDLADAHAVRAELADRRWPEIDEVVAGAQTVLIRLRSPLGPSRRRELIDLDAPRRDPAATDPITVEVSYDDADLDDVADRLGISTQEVVEVHSGQLWTVAFCGFAPGVGYLSGESDRLRVPRRSTPRTRVPAGAAGLADHWSGIYPRPGPGGWQLIGRTDASLWDLDREPSSPLHPGAVVRLIAR